MTKEKFKEKCAEILTYILGAHKTLYINFRCLPFRQAICFPFAVSRRTRFANLSGKVMVEGKLKAGNIKIGIGKTQVSDLRRDRTILDFSGTVVFKGKCKIGSGSRISVAQNAVLQFGDHFNITSNSNIICRKEILFGNETLISWGCLFMDTDQHNIYNQEGQLMNPDKPIYIGNHVWITAHCLILKGSEIPDNCVVSAGSRLNSKIEEKNTIIAGNPATITKHNITWK